jgi:ABC-2 type transport system ATP-binding protein
MDEADRLCARIGIIDRGEIVALDSPEVLKERLGGDLLEIEVSRPDPRFMERLKALDEVISLSAVDNVVSLTVSKAESFIPRCFELAREVSMEISSVALRKPNLEDVFIQLTGRDIREEEAVEPEERIRLYLRGQRR